MSFEELLTNLVLVVMNLLNDGYEFLSSLF